MKKLIFSLFVVLIATTRLSASNTQVDGIWYDFDSSTKTASVTYEGDRYYSFRGEYTGSVAIPETVTYNSTTYSVTTIGGYAFYLCDGLTSITIPNSVTSIGDRAFYGCSSLTSVEIPISVTTIGDYAFYDCISLTSIAIPNSVTKIGQGTFNGCRSLTSATIGNSITTIEYEAFNNCTTLASITIGNSVTKIEDNAFKNCFSITKTNYMGAIADWCKIEFGNDKANPIYYSHNLYVNDEEIKDLVIPNSVTTIGNYAFKYCEGLTSVTIPNSVTTISKYAFSECRRLASVAISNSVTTIGSNAFEFCCKLTSVTIPNSITTIGDWAFYYCDGLTSITIPNSVTTIGEAAFYHVNNIVYNGTAYDSRWGAKCVNGFVDEYLVYNDATKTTLCGCSTAATGEITIPNSVITIGDYAFDGCDGLTSITIPNSVTEIGDEAFYSCDGLTFIIIPNSVTLIGDDAFYLVNNVVHEGSATGSPWGAKCVNGYVDGYLVYSDASKTTLCGCSTAAIGEIIIPYSVATIGDDAFFDCSGLTSVTIPNSVTTIGIYAFASCKGLTSVTIPNSVTAIENSAFFDCSGLTSLIIGNSVTTIGKGAFDRCYRLTSITCYAVVPPQCDTHTFYNLSDYVKNYNAKVYVPASALVDYQNAEVWKDLQLYPIAADVKPIDGVNPIVTPSDQDVTITWPITNGTDTYTLTITKNSEIVCVLTFNANGQLTNIAFAAPSHNGAHQAPAATLTAQGYQFTVTGLNPGTAYNYSVTATDAGGKTLAEHKGNFSTTGGESDLQNVRSRAKATKYFHNGNLIIERNGVKYTPAGQKVR